ncbi:MAG: sensor histidine kinase [Chloroflexaceae bacterium]|nr:sensor histidine kinase [Chloroflexaceae bacterium]
MDATSTTQTAVSDSQSAVTRNLSSVQAQTGEKLYLGVRWCILIAMIGISQLIDLGPLWPLSMEHPSMLVLAGYAIIVLLSSIAVFIGPLSFLIQIAYIADIVVIALFGFLAPQSNALFFPLYLPPLISRAVRYEAMTSLLWSIAAAVLVGLNFANWHFLTEGQAAPTTFDYVMLGLQLFILLALPWLTSNLVQQWSETNRQRVHEIQQAAQQEVAHYATLNQQHAERVSALYEVADTLSSTMKWPKVFESALNEGHRLSNYTAGIVLLASGGPGQLQLVSGTGLHPNDHGSTIKVGKGPIGQAMRPSAKTMTIDAIGQEEEVQPISVLRACQSACIIPLQVTAQPYGVMIIAREQAEPFIREELDMFTALANFAVAALRNTQLLFDLKKDRDRLIEAEERAREQLARDIHDELAQTLAQIVMNIDFIKRAMVQDQEAALKELETLAVQFKRAHGEVRALLVALRPIALETQGVQAAVEQYLERLRANEPDIRMSFECIGLEQTEIDSKTENMIFNIIQESTNNAVKHSEASLISITMIRAGQNLTIKIQDNGKGFDVDEQRQAAKKRGSYGLFNIEERAKLVGGTARLSSTVGKGTIIDVHIPLDVF